MADKSRHIEVTGDGVQAAGYDVEAQRDVANKRGGADDVHAEVACAGTWRDDDQGDALGRSGGIEAQRDVSASAAAQYRSTANEHVQTLKDFWKNFLVSGLFVVAAAVIIFACLAWFLNNNQAAAKTVSMAAQGSRYTLMAEGETDPNSHVGYYERTEAERQQLGSLDTQDSMTVTLTSNLNNNDEGSLYPGAAGKITFKVMPLTTSLGNIRIDLSRALETNIAKVDENGNAIEGAAEENQKLFSLFNNHLLFFENCDANGFYSNRITGTSITIDKARFCAPNSQETTETVTVDLYWVWPEYLQNFVLVGDALYYKNLFAAVGSADGDYNALQEYINNNKADFYYGESAGSNGAAGVAAENAPDLSANMRAADIETCAELYNNADERIGSAVKYFQVRISAQEVAS